MFLYEGHCLLAVLQLLNYAVYPLFLQVRQVVFLEPHLFYIKADLLPQHLAQYGVRLVHQQPLISL
jgi:hypothetical protein